MRAPPPAPDRVPRASALPPAAPCPAGGQVRAVRAESRHASTAAISRNASAPAARVSHTCQGSTMKSLRRIGMFTALLAYFRSRQRPEKKFLFGQHRKRRGARAFQLRRQQGRLVIRANHAQGRRCLLQFRNDVEAACAKVRQRKSARRRGFLFDCDFQRHFGQHSLTMRHRIAASFDNRIEDVFRPRRLRFHVIQESLAPEGTPSAGCRGKYRETIADSMLAA